MKKEKIKVCCWSRHFQRCSKTPYLSVTMITNDNKKVAKVAASKWFKNIFFSNY